MRFPAFRTLEIPYFPCSRFFWSVLRVMYTLVCILVVFVHPWCASPPSGIAQIDSEPGSRLPISPLSSPPSFSLSLLRCSILRSPAFSLFGATPRYLCWPFFPFCRFPPCLRLAGGGLATDAAFSFFACFVIASGGAVRSRVSDARGLRAGRGAAEGGDCFGASSRPLR